MAKIQVKMGITTEMLKLIGDFGIDTLTELYNDIHIRLWTLAGRPRFRSVFIALPKSSGMRRLQNHQFNATCDKTVPKNYSKQNEK
jgi:hypothetical protein